LIELPLNQEYNNCRVLSGSLTILGSEAYVPETNIINTNYFPIHVSPVNNLLFG